MSSNGRFATDGASRKRKERDGSDASRSPPPPTPKAQPSSASVSASTAAAAAAAAANNRLLAGYLAHEFLTKGTLLGKRWDPTRPGSEAKPSQKLEPVQTEPDRAEAPKAYADVAKLLKVDGVHIPGVVNPSQLARSLGM